MFHTKGRHCFTARTEALNMSMEKTVLTQFCGSLSFTNVLDENALFLCDKARLLSILQLMRYILTELNCNPRNKNY